MKNILLLTDFSDTAQNAISYALDFFRNSECHFYILNVHKVGNYSTGNLMSAAPTSSVYSSLIENPKKKLLALQKEYEANYANESFKFETICDYDSFTVAVKQAISNFQVELIVMGTNGATGAKEVIFGSNTLNVIRDIDKPVLIIPNSFSYSTIKSVLFVSEKNELFIESKLKPLAFVIAKFKSAVQILTISANKEEAKTEKIARIHSFFKNETTSFHLMYEIAPDVAIDSFVQLNRVDLVAKMIKKQPFLKRLLKGSKTNQITYKTKVPLLIMHP